ncbi:hypothetical protein Y032_0034g2903 [Ancylostoma ceylanicum]|uniref:Uncharacterized protein n=1 Tax=Ancylostoma ceylanicum TaxID=53326 RepID=A0A016ULK6_9BILA|nr:hypothetical protein Y032_0034g2903 [Ancylostoma ceylanicum]
MGEPELQPPSLIAYSASGDRIQLPGQRQCTYSFHDASATDKFYVVNTSSNLLGAEWISKMGIYALMDSLPSTDPGQPAEINASTTEQTSSNVAKQLQWDYPQTFSDRLGLYKLSSATLQLKARAKPVFHPKRPVPYAAQPAVDKELDRLNETLRRHFQTKPAQAERGSDPIRNPPDVSLCYRATPNPALEGSKSPTELCL